MIWWIDATGNNNHNNCGCSKENKVVSAEVANAESGQKQKNPRRQVGIIIPPTLFIYDSWSILFLACRYTEMKFDQWNNQINFTGCNKQFHSWKFSVNIVHLLGVQEFLRCSTGAADLLGPLCFELFWSTLGCYILRWFRYLLCFFALCF